MPFYVAHMLRLSPDQLSLVLGVMLGSALLTAPRWPWMLQRRDPRRTGGYGPARPVQAPSVTAALRLRMVAAPGVALILAGVFLFLYLIHGERLARLEAEVRRVRRERGV